MDNADQAWSHPRRPLSRVSNAINPVAPVASFVTVRPRPSMPSTRTTVPLLPRWGLLVSAEMVEIRLALRFGVVV